MEMSLANTKTWHNAERLLEILHALSYRTGNLGDYLQTIASGVSELVGVDWSVVTFCEDDVEQVVASSLDAGAVGQSYSLHGLLTGYVVAHGHSLVVNDVEQHPEYGCGPPGYRSYLGIPLRTPQGQVIGTICSFHRQPRSFEDGEIRIVEMFAERAAIVLDNYHLYERERRFHSHLETEVHQRTEQLRAAQAQLVERERLAAIGEFAASIAHEIRNPLTTIAGVLRRLQTLALSAAYREYLDLASGEVGRLERLLQEILMYARPQALQLEAVDLTALVQEVAEELHLQGQPVQCTGTGASARAMGDRDKLKQALVNLGRNACEASPPGEPVRLALDWSEPGCVRISVHNGGEPIAPEILPRLGEPFFSTRASGTGLGLAIVRRIVEAHRGELTFHSTAAQGTTAQVRLTTC